jgi:hypothetical protein
MGTGEVRRCPWVFPTRNFWICSNRGDMPTCVASEAIVSDAGPQELERHGEYQALCRRRGKHQVGRPDAPDDSKS